MRAMHNPTRMTVIGEVAKKLAEKARSRCPDCQAPGYDVVDYMEGLPCAHCGLPTKSIRFNIYACQKCERREEVAVEKDAEDPTYCDFCNP